MRKIMLVLALFLALAVALPAHNVKAASATPSTKLTNASAALAPSQRDINIALVAVMLGSILVGYEKAIRGQRIISVRKRRGRLDE